MIDILDFEAPGWIVGWLVGRFFLAGYMRRFLAARGKELKRMAEKPPLAARVPTLPESENEIDQPYHGPQ